MTISRVACISLSMLVLGSLAGCGDGGIQEVKAWMDDIRQQTKVSIPKLSEPKKFTPFMYAGKNSVDPYNSSKLTAALLKANMNTCTKKDDGSRRRQPLELYPLDAFKMVGTINKPNLQIALLQLDKLVYEVKVGDRIGQNSGKIIKIADVAVEIIEEVPDATDGCLVDRKAKLELQETKK